MSDTTAVEGKIDYAEVMRRLPHRYPFLLVDKAEDFVPATSIVGIKNVTHNEPFFPGHFPIDPVMPGVLIVEAMAQTACVLVVSTFGAESEGKLVYFMGIEGAKFRSPVEPGCLVDFHVELTQVRGAICKFSGKAYVDGKLSAEAQCTAMIADPPKD